MLHRPLGDSDFRLARVLYYLGLSLVAAGALRPIPGIDISDCFFIASLVAVGGALVLKGATVDPALPGLFVFGFMVFSLGALFSLPGALHPSDAAGAFARFTYTMGVWFALGTIVLRTRRHVEVAIVAWIISLAISGLAAIAQVRLGQEVFASFTTIQVDPITGFTGPYAGRQMGLSEHPNALGGAAAVALAPAMLFAASRIWTEAKRYVSIGLLGLVLACIALSGSVTAFGAGIASVAIWLASGRVAIRQLLVVTATLALATSALIVINQQGASSVLSPIDRVSLTLGLTTTPLATGLDRLTLDAIAWNEIVRNPLLGVGLDGGSIAQVMGGVGVHNMFLLVWVGAGVFGALGLLLMVMSLGSTYLLEFRRSSDPIERTLVLALATSFVSFLIVALAQPDLYIRWGWVPAALLLSLRAKRLRDEKAERVVTWPTGQPAGAANAIPTFRS